MISVVKISISVFSLTIEVFNVRSFCSKFFCNNRFFSNCAFKFICFWLNLFNWINCLLSWFFSFRSSHFFISTSWKIVFCVKLPKIFSACAFISVKRLCNLPFNSLANWVISFNFWEKISHLFFNCSSSAWVGANVDILANCGWFVEPQTGQGMYGFKSLAKIPACSAKNKWLCWL